MFFLGGLGSGRGAADFGNAEDGFPAVDFIVGGGRVAESSRCEGSLGPAAVNSGQMPLHRLRGGISVQLIANVDQGLDTGHVHVVDGLEIEDDGFQSREMRDIRFGSAWLGARVVPRTIAWATPGVGVRPPCILKNVFDQIVGVVVGIGVVEAFAEPVDENSGVRSLHVDRRIRPVFVIEGHKNISRGLVMSSWLVVEFVFNQMIADHGVYLNFADE